MTVFVFVGPTLRPEEATSCLDATVLGPAAQGDIYRASLHCPTAIGIIDGFFDRVPSVWHKEILWAMSQGIHVYGGASMGALRAAELEAFGMVGVGRIFEAYRNGELEDDDEVAIVHADEENGYQPLSEAMVNIRSTLAVAQAEGVVASQICTRTESIAKQLFFPDRTWETVFNLAADSGIAPSDVMTLREWLPKGRIDQKRRDALAMLERIGNDLHEQTDRKQVHFSFEYTYAWDRVVRTCRGLESSNLSKPSDDTLELLVDEVRLQGPAAYRALIRAALGRLLAVEEGRRLGADISDAELESAASQIRCRYELEPQRDLDDWLDSLDHDREGFLTLLREEALLKRTMRDHRTPLEHYLVEELRSRGEYPGLRETAARKSKTLKQAGFENPSAKELQISQREVLSWYFEEKLGLPVPTNLLHHTRETGFETQEALSLAVLREYCFRKILVDNRTRPESRVRASSGSSTRRPAASRIR